MNIVTPKFEIIEQNPGLEGMFKHIEKCARNCYKSEDKITEDSYKKMIERLINSEHGAMLEHGTVYLRIPDKSIDGQWVYPAKGKYISNKYSYISSRLEGIANNQYVVRYVTTNYRVLVENDWLEDLEYQCEPTKFHEKRITIAFTYHLAAARDVNRHRVQSIAEESTRYCDYTKDKFAEGDHAGLNIIPPGRLDSDAIKSKLDTYFSEFNLWLEMVTDIYDESYQDWTDMDWWLFTNLTAQETYAKLKNQFGWSNQECSLVLPLGTKTCSIHTAFVHDWVHFFKLRALGHTGAPRPSIKRLATPLMELFLKNSWITEKDLEKKNGRKQVD